MSEMESFANVPETIGELKVRKHHDCGFITVREALVATLRDIDAGKIAPQFAVICMGTIEDDSKGGAPICTTDFSQAGGSFFARIGLLQRVLHCLQRD